jgi:hypothetical protein
MNNSIGEGLQRITIDEALSIINSERLSTVLGSWHYSWNLTHFYDELFISRSQSRTYVFHNTPIHEWAPAPLFSNDETLNRIIVTQGKDGDYWFLRLTDFDAYLARRSSRGLHAKSRHFPSHRTYPKHRGRIDSYAERHSLIGNEEWFVELYDRLKHPKYGHSGQRCLDQAFEANIRTPREWFAFYTLRQCATNECHAVELVIEDAQSCSGINAACITDKHGYGIFLSVEIIKSLCSRGLTSYDCGVSGRYGTYKQKLYLDMVPSDNSGILYFLEPSE